MARDYHHGDLPTALRATTVELIAEQGPAGFSLREVARRAGVSHAAPAHHFGDTRGLLTAVATEGFEALADAMTDAVEGCTDARDRLRRCGGAYVATALANPGHYKVMITHEYTDEDDPVLMSCSLRAYDVLLETVRALRDEYNPHLDVDSTATLLWCGVHGLVEIAPVLEHVAETTGTRSSPVEDLLDRYTDMVIDGIRRRETEPGRAVPSLGPDSHQR